MSKQRKLLPGERERIIEAEISKAQAQDPKGKFAINVADETDEEGNPQISVTRLPNE